METVSPRTVEEILAQEFHAKMERTKDKDRILRAKFDGDWEYAFRWLAGEMYAIQVELQVLNEIAVYAEEDGWVKSFVRMDSILTHFLDNSWNVRESSTNAISNEASTIKYKVNLEMRKWLQESVKGSNMLANKHK